MSKGVIIVFLVVRNWSIPIQIAGHKRTLSAIEIRVTDEASVDELVDFEVSGAGR